MVSLGIKPQTVKRAGISLIFINVGAHKALICLIEFSVKDVMVQVLHLYLRQQQDSTDALTYCGASESEFERVVIQVIFI